MFGKSKKQSKYSSSKRTDSNPTNIKESDKEIINEAKRRKKLMKELEVSDLKDEVLGKEEREIIDRWIKREVSNRAKGLAIAFVLLAIHVTLFMFTDSNFDPDTNINGFIVWVIFLVALVSLIFKNLNKIRILKNGPIVSKQGKILQKYFTKGFDREKGLRSTSYFADVALDKDKSYIDKIVCTFTDYINIEQDSEVILCVFSDNNANVIS